MSVKHLAWVAAPALAVLATQAPAQTMSLGEFEYRNSCAACHGAEGAGDGALAEYMTTPPPDLRRLQADNGGVFPLIETYRVISGEARVAPHGLLDMPVWGNRYRDRVDGEDMEFGPEEIEAYAARRILHLMVYLAGIQGG